VKNALYTARVESVGEDGARVLMKGVQDSGILRFVGHGG
jgi:hypothetical protein